MPDGRDTFTVRVVDRIADIAASEWDACAEGCGVPYNPFVSHCFLRALEDSGSVSAKSASGTSGSAIWCTNEVLAPFSSSRRTRYAIPGMISPAGTYTRVR